MSWYGCSLIAETMIYSKLHLALANIKPMKLVANKYSSSKTVLTRTDFNPKLTDTKKKKLQYITQCLHLPYSHPGLS